MKKIHILSVLVLLTSLTVKLQAQTGPEPNSSTNATILEPGATRAAEPMKAQRGTYQFFIVGEDSTQLKRNDLAEKIESYRDEKMVVHLKVSSTTTIRILPRNEITRAGFIPLSKEAIFQPDFDSHTAKR